jgi:hypothetical protein
MRPVRAPFRILSPALAGLLGLALPGAARAQIPGFDPSIFPSPADLVSQSTANEFIKVVGLSAANRPLEPATALGAGFAAGVELSLVQVPASFGRELAGYGVDAEMPPFLPVPRIHLQKGLGERLSVGVSGAMYRDYRILGGDVKWTFAQPEEGITAAFRLCYSDALLDFVRARTWSPQLLVSRSLHFADPYLGLAWQSTRGELAFSFTDPSLGVALPYDGSGSARAFMAFLGLQLRLPGAALQLAIEGSWSSQGANSLGTKFGFRF